jgi:hypothetical protein
MSNDEESRPPKTGYRKPPAEHRFRAGRSGNPKGRPKGSKNFKTDVSEILGTPVVIDQGGRRLRVSTQKATLMRLRDKALHGDSKAMDRMLALASLHSEIVEEPDEGQLEDEDQEILNAYRMAVRGELPSADVATNEPAAGDPSMPEPISAALKSSAFVDADEV